MPSIITTIGPQPAYGPNAPSVQKLVFHDEDHRRYTKRTADSTAELRFTKHTAANWLEVHLVTITPDKHGTVRENNIALTLDAEHVAALAAFLPKLQP